MSVIRQACAADPVPGTPEHDQLRAAHAEAVSRVAKLRLLESQLPSQILQAESRVREMAKRLHLITATQGKGKPSGREAPERLIPHLPASVAELAGITGRPDTVIRNGLNTLRQRGLVVKDPGYGGAWRVDPFGPLGARHRSDEAAVT